MPQFVINAREHLGDRQCAEHKGREEHKEEKKRRMFYHLFIDYFDMQI
jgi:hypothetical protein